MTQIKVVRSNRKTVSIIVDEDAAITVRAPRFVSDKEVKSILEKKKKWINKKVEDRLKKIVEKTQLEEDGIKRVFYMGKERKIIFKNISKTVELNDDELIINEKLRSGSNTVLIDFLKYKAYEYIAPSTHDLAKKMGTELREVKISNASKRWGSCSSRGNLNFSWRLIMAPIEVIDYVIIHEIAHLFEMNHSDRFWSIVENNCPQYKSYIKWLDQNGHLLDL